MQVDAEFHAGRLLWKDVVRLIEEFPKRGQMDVILEGQDDEGDEHIPEAIDDHCEEVGVAEVANQEAEDQDELSALADVEANRGERANAAFAELEPEEKVRAAELQENIDLCVRMLGDAKKSNQHRLINMCEAALHKGRADAMGAVEKDQGGCRVAAVARRGPSQAQSRPAAFEAETG